LRAALRATSGVNFPCFPSVIRRTGARRPNPARLFQHVRLHAGRPNSKPEPDQLAVPEKVLDLAWLSRVHAPFCNAVPHVRPPSGTILGTTREPPRGHPQE